MQEAHRKPRAAAGQDVPTSQWAPPGPIGCAEERSASTKPVNATRRPAYRTAPADAVRYRTGDGRTAALRSPPSQPVV